MINEKILVPIQMEDYSHHRLTRYIPGRMAFDKDWLINLYAPLHEVFSEVITYDYVKRMAEIGVKGINQEIIELVRQERPDYFFWLAPGYAVRETTLDAIRKEGTRVVSWICDDEYRFETYSKWWIPYLDYCVTYDIEAVAKYEALGGLAVHTIGCEGIAIERDWTKIQGKYEVSFVGRKSNPSRENYINELKTRNMPLTLFGKDWGNYVSFNDMMDIFWESKINLNFTRVTGNERFGFKGRISLVCLAGGFLLTEYTPGLENYFEIGKEIVCFENTPEMIDKINYYLAHDDERHAIAKAGWTRAINEYTPFHMLARVFSKIEQDLTAGKKPHPAALIMPRWIRNLPSQYHFQWGRGFLEANHHGLWKDSLALSLSYDALNIGARYYQIIGYLPAFIRPLFFWLYRLYEPLEKACSVFCQRLLCWADSVPVLKTVKQDIARRFYRG